MRMALFSFFKIQWFIVFCLIYIVIAIPAQAQSSSYGIGQYAVPSKEGYDNNLKLSKVLSLPGEFELEVTIEGRTEKCCDYLILYNSQNKKIGQYKGDIKEQFTIKGASLRVDFRSDKRTTDKGFLVKIFPPLPAKVFQQIKKQLLETSDLFLNLGISEAYSKIADNPQYLKSLQATVQQGVDTNQSVEQIAYQLMDIAQAYNHVAEMNAWIMTVYQEHFEILKNLNAQIQHQVYKITQKKQDYEEAVTQTQNQFTKTDNESQTENKTLLKDNNENFEEQKTALSIAAYKNIIPSLKAQEASWHKLNALQNTLEAKLQLHKNYIGLFLYTVGINGQIYQEFAQAALMGQKAILKLSQSIQFPQVCDNLTQLIKNERDIRESIQKIKDSEWNMNP
jgi:hypothetical protein